MHDAWLVRARHPKNFTETYIYQKSPTTGTQTRMYIYARCVAGSCTIPKRALQKRPTFIERALQKGHKHVYIYMVDVWLVRARYRKKLQKSPTTAIYVCKYIWMIRGGSMHETLKNPTKEIYIYQKRPTYVQRALQK